MGHYRSVIHSPDRNSETHVKERAGAIFLARIEDDSLGPLICKINNQLSLRGSPRHHSGHLVHGSRKPQRRYGFATIGSSKQTVDSFPVLDVAFPAMRVNL